MITCTVSANLWWNHYRRHQRRPELLLKHDTG